MFEYKGPIVTIVMDGIGLRESEEGNAVKLSYTPVLDKLFEQYPNLILLLIQVESFSQHFPGYYL